MDKKLRGIFNYQSFSPDSRLSSLINDTMSRYSAGTELSDDDLMFVNAAGSPEQARQSADALRSILDKADK
ncbi:MAG: hypothetical protein Q4C54_03055 [Clostridia bacterium]|nr:hypothetical protein [Clostridia bacterium]